MDAHNLVLWVQRLFTSMNRSFNTLLPLLPLIITPTVATQTLTILRRQLWLNSNFVEDLTRSLNARIKSNKEAIDIIPNITPSVSQFSTFKSHINEIDVAVKKFESNNTPLPVTSQTEFTLPIIIDFGEIFQEKIVIALMIRMKKIFLRKYPHVTVIHPWALQYPVSGKNLHASILLVTLVCTKLF